MPRSKTDGNDGNFSACDADAHFSVGNDGISQHLKELLTRRLIFVMGKGGVGKTTVSMVLAGLAEKMKKNVLLVELGDTDSIGRMYLGQTLTEQPHQLTPRIRGVRVDSRAELEDYVRAHIGSRFIATKIVNSRLFEYLFQATPGLKEVMSLGRLWRWEKEEKQLPEFPFDVIIVDAPATGHAMSLLHLPDVLIRMIRIGPLANQIRKLQHLLKNREKTGLVLVSLPEELPVNEAMEIYAMAHETLENPIHTTFINCVYPRVFTPAEGEQIQDLENAYQNQPFSYENQLIASAKQLIRNRIAQQKHISDIYAKADGNVIELPFCFTNDLTLSDIQALSSSLFSRLFKLSDPF